ncbi:DUF3343 domain-containing protein [Bengtsoniella intestinalis]|uniref:DUF3343 domain-containing protein n=1 Tax=Bengtsoniella intestinalis TaxID=3073143 RepID=UPI00391F218D
MIVFENTHSAMVAQKALAGIVSFVVMPTPRHISASCGIALKIATADVERASALLTEGLFNMFEIHNIS